ncbi:hypothetical protein [Bradyrhizobium diazoefficiens]|jgi:hypothetical protein|uniref:hypothetical protein n=1 Tax=Bradyrhizobium diazoefficiens TaxID=1355477 RepID=UPI0034982892
MTQARQADHVTDGEPRDAERPAAQSELRFGPVRQQHGQNDKGGARQHGGHP